MSLNPAQVAVVLPTRGNVDLRPILAPFRRYEQAVWDNSKETDLSVYGRYAAIERVKAPVIVTVDDDNVLPPQTIKALLAAYTPGTVVCNVPERFRKRYHDSGMVGFGAIFDRSLPQLAFERFGWNAFEPVLKGDLAGEHFYRTCDIVFTMMSPLKFVDLPYTELAYASDKTRMWKQPGHFEEREQMRELCRQIKRAAA